MKRQLRYVIGLTGLPSSGKGEVANALIDLAQRHGWRAERLVFSDQIKAEARRRGVADGQFTREVLARIGTELRETEGPGVLAQRIASEIVAWPDPGAEIFIADGVRHSGEIAALRSAFGERFLLLAIESKPEEIARRLIARRRADESPEAMRSEEKAVELLKRELNGHLSSHSPNISQCMPQADIRIPNHGTLKDLRKVVEGILADRIMNRS